MREFFRVGDTFIILIVMMVSQVYTYQNKSNYKHVQQVSYKPIKLLKTHTYIYPHWRFLLPVKMEQQVAYLPFCLKLDKICDPTVFRYSHKETTQDCVSWEKEKENEHSGFYTCTSLLPRSSFQNASREEEPPPKKAQQSKSVAGGNSQRERQRFTERVYMSLWLRPDTQCVRPKLPNTDKARRQRNQVQKHKHCRIPFFETPRTGKFRETESRLGVTRDWRRRSWKVTA